MKKTTLSIIIILLTTLIHANSQNTLPKINSQSAIMIDYETKTILYEKNADLQIPPASMTKLMTIYTALELIEQGKASLDDKVPISERADFKNAPPNSSLMFLEKGQNVTLKELLLGLSIPSGNDAGIAVAEHLAGNMDNFIDQMNKNAQKLGMKNTNFVDSSGYSAKNTTTARDYAYFCINYIEKNSKYLDYFHGQKNFTYPKPHNLALTSESTHGAITQPNHNLLIGRLEGVDGLKTGFIDESGYNLAATATKNERRIILILMGGPGNTKSDGRLKRVIDAAYLLGYGFYRWDKFIPDFPKNEEITIKNGTKDKIKIKYSKAKPVLINPENIHKLKIKRHLLEINLPIKTGDTIGEWQVIDENGKILQNGKIIAAESVDKANIIQRIFKK